MTKTNATPLRRSPRKPGGDAKTGEHPVRHAVRPKGTDGSAEEHDVPSRLAIMSPDELSETVCESLELLSRVAVTPALKASLDEKARVRLEAMFERPSEAAAISEAERLIERYKTGERNLIDLLEDIAETEGIGKVLDAETFLRLNWDEKTAHSGWFNLHLHGVYDRHNGAVRLGPSHWVFPEIDNRKTALDPRYVAVENHHLTPEEQQAGLEQRGFEIQLRFVDVSPASRHEAKADGPEAPTHA